MTTHENYIQRALQIAKNGLGTTRPNPMVGAVIVYKNTIIGEGFTCAYGGAHAEVMAIQAVKHKALLKQSTLYVTLEPCSHYGNTPPCSTLIITHHIPHVVIGCVDDNPKVAGKGIQQLKSAGCKVTVGVLEQQCKTHHKRFFTFHNKKRPYIFLKWAQTPNGDIAPKEKNTTAPVWITNALSQQLSHKWRTEEQAILVGTTTVIDDNPSLTARHWKGLNPTRVVLDRALKLNSNASVFNTKSKTLIITSKTHLKNTSKFNSNITIAFINWNHKNTIAQQICDVLYQHNINSILIEGGTKTLQTFITENLWDKARIFTGNTNFKNGIKAPLIKGKTGFKTKIGNDTLHYLIP